MDRPSAKSLGLSSTPTSVLAPTHPPSRRERRPPLARLDAQNVCTPRSGSPFIRSRRCSGATVVTSSSPISVSPPTSVGDAIGPPQRVLATERGSHHNGSSSPYRRPRSETRRCRARRGVGWHRVRLGDPDAGPEPGHALVGDAPGLARAHWPILYIGALLTRLPNAEIIYSPPFPPSPAEGIVCRDRSEPARDTSRTSRRRGTGRRDHARRPASSQRTLARGHARASWPRSRPRPPTRPCAARVVAAEPPTFSAGGALDDLLNPRAPLEEMYAGFEAIANASLVTIAAVGGPAIGAGMNVALACDVIVCSPAGALRSPLPRRGHPPRWRDPLEAPRARRSSGRRRPRAVRRGDGRRRSRRAPGSPWRCVPDDELLPRAMALAERRRSDQPRSSRARSARSTRRAAVTDGRGRRCSSSSNRSGPRCRIRCSWNGSRPSGCGSRDPPVAPD